MDLGLLHRVCKSFHCRLGELNNFDDLLWLLDHDLGHWLLIDRLPDGKQQRCVLILTIGVRMFLVMLDAVFHRRVGVVIISITTVAQLYVAVGAVLLARSVMKPLKQVKYQTCKQEQKEDTEDPTPRQARSSIAWQVVTTVALEDKVSASQASPSWGGDDFAASGPHTGLCIRVAWVGYAVAPILPGGEYTVDVTLSCLTVPRRRETRALSPGVRRHALHAPGAELLPRTTSGRTGPPNAPSRDEAIDGLGCALLHGAIPRLCQRRTSDAAR